MIKVAGVKISIGVRSVPYIHMVHKTGHIAYRGNILKMNHHKGVIQLNRSVNPSVGLQITRDEDKRIKLDWEE